MFTLGSYYGNFNVCRLIVLGMGTSMCLLMVLMALEMGTNMGVNSYGT